VIRGAQTLGMLLSPFGNLSHTSNLYYCFIVLCISYIHKYSFKRYEVLDPSLYFNCRRTQPFYGRNRVSRYETKHSWARPTPASCYHPNTIEWLSCALALDLDPSQCNIKGISFNFCLFALAQKR